MVCIAIIEGNPHLRSLLGWHLQQVGYIINQCGSIQQAKQNLANQSPTLVVLDSDLPDGDGFEFCQWLCQCHQPLILMLSAQTTEKDVVKGLKAGADDYLKKPFGMQEFLARVESLLRRFRTNNAPLSLDFGDLKIDLVQRRVEFRGQFIDLTPQEFSLLYVLSQAQGIPLSRSELLRKAWPEAIENQRTIDTHVLSLRKKIELDPRQPNVIQTVRNVGYRFNLEALQKQSYYLPSENITPSNNNHHSLNHNSHYSYNNNGRVFHDKVMGS
ncbi:response regulator transcription factor [Cyanobacterium sp. Dongsha4]|uniref:response regulator transcription factor n=1 Tax=Cyanobacterium sp. DS4 TaxID=2878255 RepID=UPI002E804D7B|nr:response regulator transcription factor [Cyanobacterium sp. Dongsha4]WVL00547.1 response regulator transcription factor [Cyanobacterium sp. Dongsha4]